MSLFLRERVFLAGSALGKTIKHMLGIRSRARRSKRSSSSSVPAAASCRGGRDKAGEREASRLSSLCAGVSVAAFKDISYLTHHLLALSLKGLLCWPEADGVSTLPCPGATRLLLPLVT